MGTQNQIKTDQLVGSFGTVRNFIAFINTVRLQSRCIFHI